MTDTARVLVRMPPELHTALKAVAAEAGCSVNTAIVAALQASQAARLERAVRQEMRERTTLWVESPAPVQRYELRGLVIRRVHGPKDRTYAVATLDSDKRQTQWQVFAKAIWEGVGEVAAVHAIDAVQSTEPV